MLAREEFGTKVDFHRVTQTLQRLSAHLTTLNIIDEAGCPSEIVSTPSHPYWVANRDSWVSAERLEPGDCVHDPHGRSLKVAAVITTALKEAASCVYNITVDEVHTYFVLTGGTKPHPILVHNANCSTFELPQTWKSAKGVSGVFSDGRHTFRIDTNNLSPGERFHVHIYDANGKEIAVVQGAGTNGIWRKSHRGRTLLKPSEVPSDLLTDIRRLLRNALDNIE